MKIRILQPTFEPSFFQKLQLALLGTGLTAIVTCLDYWTGTEIEFSVFYLIPIMIFVWFFRRRWAVLAATVCALLWFISDYASGGYRREPFVGVWNTAVIWTFFIMAVYFLSKIKSGLIRERHYNLRLLRSYEEIRKLSKARSNFVAAVSHEIRTPLVALKESVRILADGAVGAVSAEQTKYLDLASRNIDRLKRLLDNVLEFSRTEAGVKRAPDGLVVLDRIVEEAVQLYTPAASAKGLRIICDADAGTAEVSGDADKLAQVLANFLHNAVKFTDRGNIVVGTRCRDNTVEVYVQDSGCGIRQKDLRKLFVPFERLVVPGRRAEGMGLGLMISKHIIEEMGGDVAIKSEEGAGTRVSFTLPAKHTDTVKV